MTFDKAYCEELNGNVTAYRARRDYFSQDNRSLKFSFFCPDEHCNSELTGVNIYAVGKVKHKPHFRTKVHCHHSSNCSIIQNIEEIKVGIKNTEGHSNSHGLKNSKYPEEFILERPKSEIDNKSKKDIDDDFDIEPRQRRQATGGFAEKARPHKTSYLENVVDSYENMKDHEKKEAHITLNEQRRTYHSTFKKIQFFEDGKNFIFYGNIEPIKVYGKNYSIKFKNKAFINEKTYQISIYITDETVNKYRLSRLFRESIDTLTSLGNNFKSAKCYFVGSYPELKEIPLPNGKSFMAYGVFIDNLDHLVIKFTE